MEESILSNKRSSESLNRQGELLRLYLRNMQIVKFRINSIRDIQSGNKSTSYRMTNIEFCVLQIRKILELIALSALISDMDVYETHLKKIGTMWNAKLIISDIERIHPDFYPYPIYFENGEKNIWKDVEDNYLTKDKFIQIYNECGKYLHENPIALSNKEIDKRYNKVWNQITDWGILILNLLNKHIIKLYSSDNIYLIQLNNDSEAPMGNIFENVIEEERLDDQNETGNA